MRSAGSFFLVANISSEDVEAFEETMVTFEDRAALLYEWLIQPHVEANRPVPSDELAQFKQELATALEEARSAVARMVPEGDAMIAKLGLTIIGQVGFITRQRMAAAGLGTL
jgi:hypothetical protein